MSTSELCTVVELAGDAPAVAPIARLERALAAHRPAFARGDGAAPAQRTVVVVGAGNIGSQLLPHVARLGAVARVVVVDGEKYDGSNVATQAIVPGDVGQAKAHVQAERMRAIRPSLAVEAFACGLEDVPRGVFHDADLVLAGLDSRGARALLGEICFRVGVPLLDAGVDGAALLARVTAWDPAAPQAPCPRCAWSEDDYRTLAAEQPLQCAAASAAGAAPTGAPAALGGLAAALQALECGKWLAGRADRLPAGHEVMIDAASHGHLVSALRRNPRCRFDHATWAITALDAGPADLTLADALALSGTGRDASLAVSGQRFVMRLACGTCGGVATARMPRLRVSIAAGERRCAPCGAEMVPAGFDLASRLDPAALDGVDARALRDASLRELGLRPRELFTILHAGGATHYVLGPARGAAIPGVSRG